MFYNYVGSNSSILKMKHSYFWYWKIFHICVYVPAPYCTGSNLHRNDSFIGLFWGSSGITEYGNITNKPSSFTHLKRSFSVSVLNSCVSFEVITWNMCNVLLSWRLSEWMLGDVLGVRLLRGEGDGNGEVLTPVTLAGEFVCDPLEDPVETALTLALPSSTVLFAFWPRFSTFS